MSKRRSSDGSAEDPCFVDWLDAALLTAVLGRLEAAHLGSAACVCRAWAAAAANDQLWRQQFERMCTPDYRRSCAPQLGGMLSGGPPLPLPSTHRGTIGDPFPATAGAAGFARRLLRCYASI